MKKIVINSDALNIAEVLQMMYRNTINQSYEILFMPKHAHYKDNIYSKRLSFTVVISLFLSIIALKDL